jgi:hypothetical protein
MLQRVPRRSPGTTWRFRAKELEEQERPTLPAVKILQLNPGGSTPRITKLHETAIHNDAGNPRLETRFSAKPVEVPECKQVRRLHSVLAIIIGTQNTTGHPQARRVITCEQLRQSGLVSLSAMRDQFDFRFLLHIRSYAAPAATALPWTMPSFCIR